MCLQILPTSLLNISEKRGEVKNPNVNFPTLQAIKEWSSIASSTQATTYQQCQMFNQLRTWKGRFLAYYCLAFSLAFYQSLTFFFFKTLFPTTIKKKCSLYQLMQLKSILLPSKASDSVGHLLCGSKQILEAFYPRYRNILPGLKWEYSSFLSVLSHCPKYYFFQTLKLDPKEK